MRVKKYESLFPTYLSIYQSAIGKQIRSSLYPNPLKSALYLPDFMKPPSPQASSDIYIFISIRSSLYPNPGALIHRISPVERINYFTPTLTDKPGSEPLLSFWVRWFDIR